MNTNSILYSLKVWITSVVLAPVLYLTVNVCLSKRNRTDFWDFILEQISIYGGCEIFGIIFSFFTWVLFILIIKGIITCFSVFSKLKFVIASVGLVLTIGTFWAFSSASRFVEGYYYLMVANCICITGGSLFYNLMVDGKSVTVYKE
ncbi:MAG: hypothetical protein WC615_12885 [Mucilaginibacter sp.]|jgi:hypothetical protein|uniref:hypothetical protein n=1 Tax=Mucilaginibacter sp. TaxID=1882438 RepID=UPI0035632E79